MFSFSFFSRSALLGVGLSMDAFSVSVANGLNEPKMKRKKQIAIATTFALFQLVMPLIGWVCVHTIISYFNAFESFVPWIALALLTFIGVKTIIDGIKKEQSVVAVGVGGLIVQGIATSIDALSVGFTIANYNFTQALVCSASIGIVTFAVCVLGVFIGKKFGDKLSNKASVIGGIILIAIGLEIFLKGILA